MYKLTGITDTFPVYDSLSRPLPEGTVYFHTHQLLWKNDIQIGRIFIDNHFARLILGCNKPINIPRDKFQELFMKDAQIVELIFSAIEVKSVQMFLKDVYQVPLSKNCKVVRLNQIIDGKSSFYADLVYRVK